MGESDGVCVSKKKKARGENLQLNGDVDKRRVPLN